MYIKTLITLLVFAPMAASADIQLYGNIRSGVSVSQTKIATGGNNTRTAVEDLGSYVGFRGSHAIGGGSKVIWQFEQDTPVGSSGSMREYFKRKKENSTIHAGG
ncbi:porin [Neisseria dumasiana]|uniref:Porin domain-containing protein n=1 Tax=Neisseria dumasiana TaxID=1931275 RepID=A0ABX3WK44_9NEIS|nr:porin [Neisseria dumasiana]OSI33862.1 hypothetical protein BV913_08365 [Neisseria dumasiana]UOO84579.1 porin [Neisseria dumasiana]